VEYGGQEADMKVIARSSNLLGKITILVMVVLCVNTAIALDGSGTEQDPWRIQSLDDFNDFAADANYWDDYTRLETDVNLAGRIYTTAVIALDTDNTNYTFEGTSFSGIFDGAGHRVNNLTIDDGGVGNDYLGLFGYTENGQVNNLGVKNIIIRVLQESYFIGGLIGLNNTTALTNCHVSGEISAEKYSRVIGGMIGRNIDAEIDNCNTANNIYPGMHTTEVGGLIGSNVNGVITNCYTTGAVSGEYKSYELGGLIGRCNDGTITDCYTTGDVNGYGQFGGLVGHNVDNIVTNCYATGTLTGGGWGRVGGLIGENAYAQINNCYAVGDIIGEHYSYGLGGLIGHNNGSAGGGTVMNCFAVGTVTGGDFSKLLGGLIGENAYATTINSYATGAVISGDSSDLIGGLVGENHYSNINDCYTKASVVSGDNSDSIGGLVGYNIYSINREIGVIRNCYAIGEVIVGNNSQNLGGFAGYINNIEHINGVWNIETSGLDDGVGNLEPDPNGIEGKTSSEMKQQSTFTDWDFINVWDIGENQTYPYLRIYLPSDINKDGIVNFLDVAITANQWMEGVE
jgi:hypothetical protein